MLFGEVPETFLKVQASDISNMCEFSWYQWLIFGGIPVQYPADNLVLGRYLVPTRYV